MCLSRSLLRGLLTLLSSTVGLPAVFAGSKPPSHSPEQLLRQGRFGDAERALTERAAVRPDDSATLLGLGYLGLLRNDLNDAERHLSRLLQVRRNLKEAQALLAEVYYRRDDFPRAAPLFERAGQTAKARKLASFAGRKPYESDAASPRLTRLPFVRTDPLPVVTVRVNGSEPARFLVDTGGGELILDGTFAQQVAAARFGSERSYFAGGKAAAVEHGRVDSVGLGDLTLRNVPVNIMDLSPVGPALGEARIDGILGTVLLYHFLSTIDYANGELVLERPGATAPDHAPVGPDTSDVALPFWMADDHFIVTWGSVNRGPQRLFFVDTGLAGAGFTCPPSTVKAAGIELRRDQAGTGPGGGGEVAFVPFVVDELRLGEIRREHIDGAAGPFPPQLEWDLGFHIGGLISHQFFRPGALTLDFAAMRLRVRSRTAPASN